MLYNTLFKVNKLFSKLATEVYYKNLVIRRRQTKMLYRKLNTKGNDGEQGKQEAEESDENKWLVDNNNNDKVALLNKIKENTKSTQTLIVNCENMLALFTLRRLLPLVFSSGLFNKNTKRIEIINSSLRQYNLFIDYVHYGGANHVDSFE